MFVTSEMCTIVQRSLTYFEKIRNLKIAFLRTCRHPVFIKQD